MKLTHYLGKIARDLREGIPTDLPRQRMDYAARQLETLAAMPIPDITNVAPNGDATLVLHLRRPATAQEIRGLYMLLTGEQPT